MIRLLSVSPRLSRHVFQVGVLCLPAFSSLGCAVASGPESEPEQVGSVAQAVTLSATEICNQDPRVNLGMVPLAVCAGARLFFDETFSGNGRTCGSCHPAANNYTIDVMFTSTLPPSDPLFVA